MAVAHVEASEAGGSSGSGAAAGPGARWTAALVNIMPDAAFEETERQFLDLLAAGSGTRPIATDLYALSGVPRGATALERISERYSPIEDLYRRPPDVLVMTGANPVQPVLSDEPYWAEMAALLSWASEHVHSLVLSCLAAHAALTVFDGLERSRLDRKCAGVFVQQVDQDHPLSAGLGPRVALPHSRLNDVPGEAVRAAGYDVPVFSDATGWSVATKTVGQAAVVLLQAHPEYGSASLLREYRRDARRFVCRERDEVPVLPYHCTAPGDWESALLLQQRFASGDRAPALFETFPFDEIEARSTRPWRTVAERLYGNWLSGVPMGSE